VHFDDELGFLTTSVDFKDERYGDFQRWWRISACEHEEMCIAEERIGNWSGIGQLVGELRSRPGDFPILLEMLDGRANGGFTEPSDCATALTELALLRAIGGDQKPFLVRAGRDDVVAFEGPVAASYDQPEFLAVQDGELLVVRGGPALSAAIAVGPAGRVITGEACTGEVLWKSAELFYEPLQTLAGDAQPVRHYVDGGGLIETWSAQPDPDVLHEKARLTDRGSGREILVSCCLPGVDEACDLRTTMRSTVEEDNWWTINAITRLCEAAVASKRRLYYR
jgi:hypothetical protein